MRSFTIIKGDDVIKGDNKESMDIIQKIKKSHDKIIQLYLSVPIHNRLDKNPATGWSIKDILAHIAAWEWRCAGMLELAHETNMPFRGNPDVDALNHEFFQDRHDLSWEEVETDFREAHEALLTAIRALPPERLNDAIIQKTIAEETWEHYEEHLVDLRSVISK